MASTKTRAYPKTNSLAFSKVDCHTCLRLGETCDRQRPRCRTCLRAKRDCGGYVMDLKWKGDSLSNDYRAPESLNENSLIADGEDRTPRSGDQSFRFVTVGSKRRRRNVSRFGAFKDLTSIFDASDTTHDNRRGRSGPAYREVAAASSTPSCQSPEYEVNLNTSDCEAGVSVDHVHDIRDHQALTRFWSPWSNVDSGNCISNINSTFDDAPDVESTDQVESNFSRDQIDACQTMVLANGASSPAMNGLTLSSVLFNNQAHKWEAVLDLYDQEFCMLPLTQDCPSNPFRIRKDRFTSSDFVLHAVLALASQHIAKKDPSTSLLTATLDHQATALTLFRQALTHTSPFTLLDTILLLVNFEATQTASGTWSIHLTAALKILSSIGISEACRRSSRTRAQIAMLIWWDVTLAFIARKDLIFPLRYLQTLMQHGTEDGWNYFTLNGCPADLVMFMARFAKFAALYAKAEPIGCFNDAPVQTLIGQVRSWTNPEDGMPGDDPDCAEDTDPDTRRNRFHCIEAWRHAILLYAYRVFTRKQPPQRLRAITHLARVILDHVRCIPPTEVVQKQTLLPVFLAAAEVEDGTTRAWVRSYCDHWTVTARFDMFITAAALLEIIWADWRVGTRDVYWWGCKVGGSGAEEGDELLISEILLG